LNSTHASAKRCRRSLDPRHQIDCADGRFCDDPVTAALPQAGLSSRFLHLSSRGTGISFRAFRLETRTASLHSPTRPQLAHLAQDIGYRLPTFQPFDPPVLWTEAARISGCGISRSTAANPHVSAGLRQGRA
jgi:hypothetical protein